MTKVRFLQDYRGQYTGEVFYTTGTVAPFPFAVASALVEDGRAEYIDPPTDGAGAGVTVGPAPAPSVSLASLTVAELREMAKAAGVDGFTKMKKAQLIAALGG